MENYCKFLSVPSNCWLQRRWSDISNSAVLPGWLVLSDKRSLWLRNVFCLALKDEARSCVLKAFTSVPPFLTPKKNPGFQTAPGLSAVFAISNCRDCLVMTRVSPYHVSVLSSMYREWALRFSQRDQGMNFTQAEEIRLVFCFEFKVKLRFCEATAWGMSETPSLVTSSLSSGCGLKAQALTSGLSTSVHRYVKCRLVYSQKASLTFQNSSMTQHFLQASYTHKLSTLELLCNNKCFCPR